MKFDLIGGRSSRQNQSVINGEAKVAGKLTRSARRAEAKGKQFKKMTDSFLPMRTR